MRPFTKRLITTRRKHWRALCTKHGLRLDYAINDEGEGAFNEVFLNREYSTGFPFYTAATVVDIGAHFGYFSLFAAKNLAPDARIVAVEPAPDNARVIRQNLADNNLANITLAECGIAAEPGHLPLYGGRSVNRSLVHDYALGNSQAGSDTVEVITLADLFDRQKLSSVDFLKLDCEGAEYGILRHTSNELLQRIGCISLEFHDLKRRESTGLDLVKRLEAAGFELLHFSHSPTTMGLNYGRIVAWRP